MSAAAGVVVGYSAASAEEVEKSKLTICILTKCSWMSREFLTSSVVKL